jgi:cell division protein FtsB
MAALITLRWTLNDIQKQTQDMKAEAARLEQENAELEDKIDQLGSVQSAMDIAQEELGLVDPDTVVIETD